MFPLFAGPAKLPRRTHVAVCSAAGAVLLLVVAPADFYLLLGVILCLSAFSALAVSGFVPPPKPLAEISLFASQVAWLFGVLRAALLLGLSASIAVAAQFDWDSARERGITAQEHALLQDPIETPLLVAIILGFAILACRYAIYLARSGAAVRRKATIELQLRWFHAEDRRATRILCATTHPASAFVSLLFAPMLVEVLLDSMLRS